MASMGGKSQRQSYLLSLNDNNFKYSLTDGTDIPPPEKEDPPPLTTLAPLKPAGGPLNSHPSTPNELSMPGSWPSERKTSPPDPGPCARPPTSQDSTRPSSPDARLPRPSTATVRRLFSLGNLRSSFASSRTSLMLPRGSNDDSSLVLEPGARGNSLKRSASPSRASTSTHASPDRRPETRGRRSGSWLRRKSNMFMLNDRHALTSVEEDRRPDTRESKRSKLNGGGAPLLPEVGALGGGAALSDGDLGWDASLFQRG